MKDYEISYLRKKLLEEKEKHQQAIEVNKETNIYNLMETNDSELSMYDNHPADTASETFEIEKQLALQNHREKYIKDIDYALNKIEKGSYGICEICGQEIEYDRLEAYPISKLCIKCQKQHNITIDELQDADRPVEEDVLKTPFSRTFTDKTDNNAYDGEDTWQDLAGYNKTPNYALDWYDNNFYDDEEKLDDTKKSIEDISNEEYKSQLP